MDATTRSKALTAAAAVAGVASAVALLPSENRRKMLGRLGILMELAGIQARSLLAGMRDEGTVGEYLGENLDVLRFLKLMYLFRCDVLDTNGDILANPPAHLQHMVRCPCCGARLLRRKAGAPSLAGRPPADRHRCPAPFPSPLRPGGRDGGGKSRGGQRQRRA